MFVRSIQIHRFQRDYRSVLRNGLVRACQAGTRSSTKRFVTRRISIALHIRLSLFLTTGNSLKNLRTSLIVSHVPTQIERGDSVSIIVIPALVANLTFPPGTVNTGCSERNCFCSHANSASRKQSPPMPQIHQRRSKDTLRYDTIRKEDINVD